MDVPGPANTCPPQFSQYRPRRSERMRPPTRLPDSSSTVSQWRSRQAAARPASPPPTMTTSFMPVPPAKSTQSDRVWACRRPEEAETGWPNRVQLTLQLYPGTKLIYLSNVGAGPW